MCSVCRAGITEWLVLSLLNTGSHLAVPAWSWIQGCAGAFTWRLLLLLKIAAEYWNNYGWRLPGCPKSVFYRELHLCARGWIELPAKNSPSSLRYLSAPSLGCLKVCLMLSAEMRSLGFSPCLLGKTKTCRYPEGLELPAHLLPFCVVPTAQGE